MDVLTIDQEFSVSRVLCWVLVGETGITWVISYAEITRILSQEVSRSNQL